MMGLVYLLVAVVAGAVTYWGVSRRLRAERARAEEALNVSEARYQDLYESAPEMMASVDARSGLIVRCNQTLVDGLGHPREEILGRSLFDLYDPESVEDARQAFQAFVSTGEVYWPDLVLRRKDGSKIDVSLNASAVRDPDGEIVRARLVWHDITDRRASELALRRSEEDLADFFDNATLGLHWVGPDGIILRANRADLDLLGYAAEEYVGRHIAEFHVDNAVALDIRDRLMRGEVVREYRARLRRKDGTIRHVLIDASVLWQDGKFVHTRTFTRDMTAVREAESQVHDLREALEHAVEGIARLDADGRVRAANPAYAAMYGRTPAELVGVDRRSIVHRDDVAALDSALRSMIAHGRAEVDLRGVRKDGSIFYQRATLVVSRGPDGSVNGWYSFTKDITQRKLADRQLRESFSRQNELFRREKTLLRELNHRVRNNLAGLLGLVGLYERSGRSAPEIGHAIRGKIRAMKEVHDMISRTHGTPVDLASLVARLSADLAPGERTGRLSAAGPPVDVPHSQAVALAMLLQELMTNAGKYGALSVPNGTVTVSWAFDENAEDHTLRMDWVERGGPRPTPSPSPGIGFGLIEGLAGAELQGRCTFNFDPEGLHFSLEVMLEGAAVRPVAVPT